MVSWLDRKSAFAKAMAGQEQKACPFGPGAAGDTLRVGNGGAQKY